MNFEQRIAYEIGVKLAHEEYMEKEAIIGAAKALWTGFRATKGGLAGSANIGIDTAKLLTGFGGGSGTAGAIKRTLGGATGFGIMGAASAEEGNALKGFAGGFAGGLVFSGAMPLVGRAGKLLNRSNYAQSKGLSMAARNQARALDASKQTVKQLEKQVNKAGTGASDVLKTELKNRQAALKSQQDAYKQFLKDKEGVGMFGMMGRAIGQNLGTGVGVVGGMGGGMYASGLVQGHIDAKQRPLLAYQNNVFNPVG